MFSTQGHNRAFSPVDALSAWENQERVNHYDNNASFQQYWYRDLFDTVTSEGLVRGEILDLGCSSGIFIHEQACRYPDTTFHGVDYSRAMIAQAQEKYAEQENLSFFQGDAQNLAATEGLHDQYPLILAATVLHWVPDQEAALRSMYEHLAPGGQIIVRTFDQAPGTQFIDPAIAAIEDLLPDEPSPLYAKIYGRLHGNWRNIECESNAFCTHDTRSTFTFIRKRC